MERRSYRKPVNWFFNRPDYVYRLDEFGKTTNLLFITGLSGSGQSTLGRRLAQKYHATLCSTDWLLFSWCYRKCPEAQFFLKMFWDQYPATKTYCTERSWFRPPMTYRERKAYIQKFYRMITEYAIQHPEQLFVVEGNLINYEPATFFQPYAVVIKGTSVLSCLWRRSVRKIGICNLLILYTLARGIQRNVFAVGSRYQINQLIAELKKLPR